MSNRIVLSASAVVFGVAGVAALFAPQEMLAAFSTDPKGVLPLLVQLVGALYFSAAMMNWTSRGSLIGGIYNRAVSLANLTHFTIGTLVLAKGAAAERTGVVWIAVAVYLVFTVAFARIFFGGGTVAAPTETR
jgi:hypothetical protein